MIAKTKIVCTIGPATSSYEKILELAQAGMNVARLNLSHGDIEGHLTVISYLKKVRKELKIPLAIMLDTKGPEIRVGIMDKSLEVYPRSRLIFSKKENLDSSDLKKDYPIIPVEPLSVLSHIKEGMVVLFDDGHVISEVSHVSEDYLELVVQNQGEILSQKGINIPGVEMGLPSITPKDLANIKLACREDLDYIAVSFVRVAEDILTVRQIIQESKKAAPLVIAKIENAQGVQNFDSILQVADGIMVARGDLGVEVALHQLPQLQKMMIRKSYISGKPVLTATQMLESMIHHYRPTRAETSDVANAIYDGTSAVMLSGETAVGKYPSETVRVMQRIIKAAEQDFNYEQFLENYSHIVYRDVPSSVTLAVVKTAYSANAKAIFACTSSGSTARLLSRLRPKAPIIALTSDEKSYHQLAFNWGVLPFYIPNISCIEEAIDTISRLSYQEGLISDGDLVVICAGAPFGVRGTTNMMMVESIGDVLLRAYKGAGKVASGKVSLVLSPEDRDPGSIQGHLLVMPACNDKYLPLVKQASGIILQNHLEDIESEKYVMLLSKALDIPVVVRAQGACEILKEGQNITIDPKRAVVYKAAKSTKIKTS